MGLFGLKKPFQKESVNNYTNVLVPLESAKRHDTVIAGYERRRSAESLRGSTDGAALKDAGEKDNEKGIESKVHSPYSIEGLRAEVFDEMAARGDGHDSAYDCEF